jgi:hypothetical protein
MSMRHKVEALIRIKCFCFLEMITICQYRAIVQALEYSKGDLKLVAQEQFQEQDHVRFLSHDTRQHHSLRLPPSSPYDKFLKAAGC